MDRDAMIVTLALHGFEPWETAWAALTLWNPSTNVEMRAIRIGNNNCYVTHAVINEVLAERPQSWDRCDERFLAGAIERLKEQHNEPA